MGVAAALYNPRKGVLTMDVLGVTVTILAFTETEERNDASYRDDIRVFSNGTLIASIGPNITGTFTIAGIAFTCTNTSSSNVVCWELKCKDQISVPITIPSRGVDIIKLISYRHLGTLYPHDYYAAIGSISAE